MDKTVGQMSNRKKYLMFGGLGVASVIVVAFGTLALLKAYAPVKMGASTQSTSQNQGDSSSTVPIIPTATTSTAVDNLQTLLQSDASNDSAINTALNDDKQQISVPTE